MIKRIVFLIALTIGYGMSLVFTGPAGGFAQDPPGPLPEHAEMDMWPPMSGCNDKKMDDPEYCQQPESPCSAKSDLECPYLVPPSCSGVVGTYANLVHKACVAFDPPPLVAPRRCKFRSALSCCVSTYACHWDAESEECEMPDWCNDSGIHESQDEACP